MSNKEESNRIRFTKHNVGKLRPPEGKNDVVIWDEGMPGFGIRFRHGGPGVYIVQYKVNGRNGKMTIDPVSKITLDDAKQKARAHFSLVADDINPAIERAKRAAKLVMFKDKIPAYLENLRKLDRTKKYIDDNKRSLGSDFGTDNEVAGYFAELHKFAFSELEGLDGRALIASELNKIEEQHGTGAMRDSRAHLNGYLSWAVKEGFMASNTGAGTRKPPTVKRDRILAPETEIIPIWALLSTREDDFSTICKLLFLTWTRRDEIASLHKSEVDRKKRLIDLPPERTKNGLRHIVPLSTQAWNILEPKLDQRDDSEFVFGHGDGGFSGWHRATCRFREAVGAGTEMKHFTLHDFRRTARSLGVRRPVSIFPHIAEAILNHISTVESGKQGVAGVYDVNDPWQYFEEKGEALQEWADYIDGLFTRQLPVAA